MNSDLIGFPLSLPTSQIRVRQWSSGWQSGDITHLDHLDHPKEAQGERGEDEEQREKGEHMGKQARALLTRGLVT